LKGAREFGRIGAIELSWLRLQGDEAGEHECNNSDEGNGAVNVTHDCPYLPMPAQSPGAAVLADAMILPIGPRGKPLGLVGNPLGTQYDISRSYRDASVPRLWSVQRN
jgi:hypothetical protein